MKKSVDVLAAVAFSVGSLLLFQLPNFFPGDWNAIYQYSLMALSFTYFVFSYRLPTLKYFRLPEISIPSFAGFIMVFFVAWPRMTSNHAITLPLWPTIAGLVYLAVIGLGEEIVSRGFVFGVLRKHGRALALILSSVFFGAMHVNVYLGSDWSAYSAYWHSVSAAGFGFLMACIMIVTRSILMPIIAHALFDWTVVFSAPSKDHTQKIYHFDPLWQTIKDTGAELMINVSLGLGLLAILWICRVARVPKWFISIARKLKMIEPVLHS